MKPITPYVDNSRWEECSRTASGVVCVNNNKILMLNSLKGPYTVLPKGGVEEGLSAEDNAFKELAEEAGYAATLFPEPIFDNYVVYPESEYGPERVQREIYFYGHSPSDVAWEEKDLRGERKWLTLLEALDVASRVQRTVILNAFDLHCSFEEDKE